MASHHHARAKARSAVKVGIFGMTTPDDPMYNPYPVQIDRMFIDCPVIATRSGTVARHAQLASLIACTLAARGVRADLPPCNLPPDATIEQRNAMVGLCSAPFAKPPPPVTFANLTLFSPIALYSDAERRVFHLELGLVYSNVLGVDGIGVSLGVLRMEGDSRGLMIGAIATGAGSMADVQGVEIGGLAAAGEQNLSGLQIAGLIGGASPLRGVAITGLMSFDSTQVYGAHLTGGLGVVDGNLHGAQISGLASLAGGMTSGGLQMAGLLNWSQEKMNGLQLAGLVNGVGELNGVQVALVNIAERVEGVQLGLVNFAEKVDGISLGLVNVSKSATYEPTTWVATGDTRRDALSLGAHVGLKTLFRTFYTLAAVGAVEPNGVAAAHGWAASFGAGAHFIEQQPAAVQPFIDTEMLYTYEGGSVGPTHALIYRSAIGFRLGRVDVFGGVGLRQHVAPVVFLPHAFTGVSVELSRPDAPQRRYRRQSIDSVY